MFHRFKRIRYYSNRYAMYAEIPIVIENYRDIIAIFFTVLIQLFMRRISFVQPIFHRLRNNNFEIFININSIKRVSLYFLKSKSFLDNNHIVQK